LFFLPMPILCCKKKEEEEEVSEKGTTHTGMHIGRKMVDVGQGLR
jgi:hypothetical protein